MADATITVSVSLLLFGLEQTTKYGAATYGVSTWGIGDYDLLTNVDKYISESLTADQSQNLATNKYISESFTPAFETSSESMADGGGWSYVFVKPTEEAEERSLASYVSSTAPTDSWTTVTNTSQSWS